MSSYAMGRDLDWP